MAKQKKQKAVESCEFCGESSCKCKKNTLKVYLCPNCKSPDVGFMFQIRNLYGLFPKMKCKSCGYEARIFPQLVVSKKKLEQLNKKSKKKNKTRKKK